MKDYISGIVEFLLFIVFVAGLMALRHTRFDNYLAIAWVSLLTVASVRLVYKGWSMRNDSSMAALTGRWSSVLPPRLMRWMYGEDGKTPPKKNDSGKVDQGWGSWVRFLTVSAVSSYELPIRLRARMSRARLNEGSSTADRWPF